MIKSLVRFGLVFTSLTVATQAATVAVSGGFLRDAGGAPIIPSFVWALVVDKAGDGFADPTPGDYVGGSGDDMVVGGLQLSETANRLGGFDGTVDAAVSIPNPADVAGLDASDALRIVWFPTISSTGSSPMAGDPFGSYRTDDATIDGSSIAFVYPGDGDTESINIRDADAGGSVANAAFNADQIVPIPEPSAAGLLLMGVMSLFVRRRR